MTNLPDLESNEESTRVSDQILSMLDILISQVCMMLFFKTLSNSNQRASYSFSLALVLLSAANTNNITPIHSPAKSMFVKLA